MMDAFLRRIIDIIVYGSEEKDCRRANCFGSNSVRDRLRILKPGMDPMYWG